MEPALGWVVSSLGHLIFEITMGFIAFGSVVAMFAGLIGFANAKLGRLADARSWYDKALAADPNHLSTWGYSGALHVSHGDLDKARADLTRIKAICGGTGCREYQELESLIATKAR